MEQIKSVLVTGSGGYIGRHIVNELLSAGYEVIANDINIFDVNPKARVIIGDIFTDTSRILSHFPIPDVCIHLAWRNGFIHNSATHIQDLPLHYDFITGLINHGIHHIAVLGTMHEIGYFEGEADENVQCNPISLYGIAKDALRRSLFCSIDENKTVFQWLRAFYLVGDDIHNHSVFTKIIQSVNAGQKSFPLNSGKNQYDFIDIHDFAKMVVASISQDKVTGVINCCSGIPVPLGEKIEQFIKENCLQINLEYGIFPDRKYDSPVVYGNTSKIDQVMAGLNNS
jgi:nucleoside-diphosphate-sugar epimerase